MSKSSQLLLGLEAQLQVEPYESMCPCDNYIKEREREIDMYIYIYIYIYTHFFALHYSLYRYFRALVYTIWLDGPLREWVQGLGLKVIWVMGL